MSAIKIHIVFYFSFTVIYVNMWKFLKPSTSMLGHFVNFSRFSINIWCAYTCIKRGRHYNVCNCSYVLLVWPPLRQHVIIRGMIQNSPELITVSKCFIVYFRKNYHLRKELIRCTSSKLNMDFMRGKNTTKDRFNIQSKMS